MIVLTPFILLAITSISLLVIRLARPRFSYYWLVAVCGTLLTWLTVLLTQLWLPTEWTIITGQLEELFVVSPALILDRFSWPSTLALTTLTLAATLTDIVHPVLTDQPRSSWSDMAGWLAISAAGLLTILVGNLVALLLAWSTMDILEISVRLTKARENEQVKRIVKDFSMHIASLLLVMWAGILNSSAGQPSSWQAITPQASQFLFLAVILRVAVLPIRSSISGELSLSRTYYIISNLVPAFVSLAVLSRLTLPAYSQIAGAPPATSTFFLAWLGISALFCSLSWANASDEIEGLPYWIVGTACLSLASTLLGQPTASIVWTIALLLSGGLLFLFSLRREWLLPLPLLGAIFFTAMPLTPTWQGAILYTSHVNFLTVLLMIDHGLLLGGYFRHALRSPGTSIKAERWTWAILLIGLLLLPLIQYVIAWWSVTSSTGEPLSSLPWTEWWPGFVILAIAGLFLFWNQRGRTIPSRPISLLRFFLSFEWLSRLSIIMDEFMTTFFTTLNRILEGRAGILWAMLILTLLLSLVSQVLAGS